MTDLKKKDWKSVGSDMADGMMSGLNGIFSGLSKWASNVASQISGAVNGRSSIGTSARSSVSRMAVASIPESYAAYSLPKLANGAVIPPNQQFAAILGDQRSGMNVETPLKTIEQALRNVMSETGMYGDINITVESILDGKVVARNTVKHINSMTRSTGRSPLYT